MNPRLSFLVALVLALPASAEKDAAGVSSGQALPFDRTVINRYSLDHLPRSLSVRQGKDVWLGYDLERGKLYKAWQAPVGKPGLIRSEFVTRSAGTAWFEDAGEETWILRRGEKTVPLKVRYLGCSHREAHVELSWELRHDTGAVKLVERIPWSAAPDERVARELRAESLALGDVLLPPPPVQASWKLSKAEAAGPVALTGAEWQRWILR